VFVQVYRRGGQFHRQLQGLGQVLATPARLGQVLHEGDQAALPFVSTSAGQESTGADAPVGGLGQVAAGQVQQRGKALHTGRHPVQALPGDQPRLRQPPAQLGRRRERRARRQYRVGQFLGAVEQHVRGRRAQGRVREKPFPVLRDLFQQ
jgi:hypothetical protein